MTFELEIAEAAHEDITRNAVWWADHHSYDQAIRWRDAIHKQLESLRDLPERHPFAAENPQFKYDLREKLVGLGNQRGYRHTLARWPVGKYLTKAAILTR